MRRREAIAGIFAAAVGASLAQAQHRIFRIGIVEPISADLNAPNLAAFRQGLEELGYVEGRNLVLEYRSADGDASRFPGLLRDLIATRVDLLVTRGTPASLAAKQATTTIPVVMAGVGEPLLIVESLGRPGGNITGFSGIQPDLEPKRLELLQELAPGTSTVVALLNLGNPVTGPQAKALESAAFARGLRLKVVDVRSREDIESAFGTLTPGGVAFVVGLDGLTQANRDLIARLAAQHRVPAVYGGREFVVAGGLVFYGPNFPDMYRRAATYVNRILKGAKPADLPVEQPATFEMVINLRAARALRLVIPPSILARADEVIE